MLPASTHSCCQFCSLFTERTLHNSPEHKCAMQQFHKWFSDCSIRTSPKVISCYSSHMQICATGTEHLLIALFWCKYWIKELFSHILCSARNSYMIISFVYAWHIYYSFICEPTPTLKKTNKKKTLSTPQIISQIISYGPYSKVNLPFLHYHSKQISVSLCS